MTLIDRLRALFPEASGRSLKQWLEHGRVDVNGRVVRDARTAVAPGDRVALRSHGEVVFPAPLRLVHEDQEIFSGSGRTIRPSAATSPPSTRWPARSSTTEIFVDPALAWPRLKIATILARKALGFAI